MTRKEPSFWTSGRPSATFGSLWGRAGSWYGVRVRLCSWHISQLADLAG
jgi:hypothetical protein